MFSTIELNGMREVQEGHMMDECIIYHVTGKTKNSRGEPVKSFAAGFWSICGVETSPKMLSYASSYAKTEIDAVLRLPLKVNVYPGDEIEITKRFGQNTEVQRYEVTAFTKQGPSGRQAYLKVAGVA